MKAPHLLTGQRAEQAASKWLQQRGLRLLQRNYRCRFGELDLIMLQAECLVFVEVRCRAGNAYGGALASVTHSKQKKLQRAAQHFLQRHSNHRHRPVRFDVVALTGSPENQKFDWLQQAFNADSSG